MKNNKASMTTVVISAVCALGFGVAIGLFLCGKNSRRADTTNSISMNNDLANKSVEELNKRLSEQMLDAQFTKLEQVISLLGFSSLMSEGKLIGLTITDAMKEEFKKSMQEKYSREFFLNLNAASAGGFTKEELISIINFHDTESGKKYLEVSPKIMQIPISNVPQGHGSLLQKMAETLVVKHKEASNKGNP